MAHRHWTFAIPRVLRRLFERDYKLLSVLSPTAYASIQKTCQARFDRGDVRRGCVVSLQTSGANGANFKTHAHALVSDRVFTPGGEFLQAPAVDPGAVL